MGIVDHGPREAPGSEITVEKISETTNNPEKKIGIRPYYLKKKFHIPKEYLSRRNASLPLTFGFALIR